MQGDIWGAEHSLSNSALLAFSMFIYLLHSRLEPFDVKFPMQHPMVAWGISGTVVQEGFQLDCNKMREMLCWGVGVRRGALVSPKRV